MGKNYSYMVMTRCFTYNQANYIEDALNGFCMQETTFPFITTIVDDASTDGEPDVIRKYLSANFNDPFRTVDTEDYILICAQHKTNLNLTIAVYFLKYNHHSIKKKKLPYFIEWFNNSKYIALCEGDDCWIHPHKLQMQVDFMEQHTDYSLIHTDFKLSKGIRFKNKIFISSNDYYFPNIITEGNHPIATLTSLYRKQYYDTIPKLWEGRNFGMGDKPLWIELSKIGKIKYLNVVTSSYRVLSESASHSRDINKMIDFFKKGKEITLFYANHYGIEINMDALDRRYYTKYIQIACKLNNKDIAKKYFLEAKERRIVSVKMMMLYVATFFKPLKWMMQLLFGNF